MSSKTQTLSLEEATFEIHQACIAAIERRESSPFFFITGAGVSYPPIPLAGHIIEHCKEKAQRHPALSKPQSGTTLNEYSHWFSLAYPQPHHRKQYFEKLISGNYISPANFRLAHLLLNEDPDKRLTNLVFTLNFDDFLTRALTTFGKNHVVCDHPQTTARIDLTDGNTPQIVHVHGSYNFYDCRNLANEIANAAELSLTSQSMPSLLDAALRNRAPLVIGYSGWEGDIVMSALKRRLAGQTLPFNIYWFCYIPGSLDTLPTWLKDHENVRFVINTAEQTQSSASTQTEASGPIASAGSILTSNSISKNSLPAHAVFEALSRQFSIPAPSISQDPLEFFASQMEKTLPQDDPFSEIEDIYQFRSVVRTIRAARSSSTDRPKEEITSTLEDVRNAIRSSQFESAIRIAGNAPHHISPEQRSELISLLFSAATSLENTPNTETLAYDAILKIHPPANAPDADAISAAHARALTSKAEIDYDQKRFDNALTTTDECISRFMNSAIPATRDQLLGALTLKGAALHSIGKTGDALKTFETAITLQGPFSQNPAEDAIKRVPAILGYAELLAVSDKTESAIATIDGIFKINTAPLPAELGAQAKVLKANFLYRSGQHEAAEKINTEVTTTQNKDHNQELAYWIRAAKYNQAVRARESGMNIEAASLFQSIKQELQDTASPRTRTILHRTILNQSIINVNLELFTNALSNCDELIFLLPNRDPEHQVFWETALYVRGVSLFGLSRTQESISSFETLIKLYGGSQESDAKRRVARSYLFLCDGYASLNQKEVARDWLTRATAYIEENFPDGGNGLSDLVNKAQTSINGPSR
ncbi:hypothetical protein D7X74_16820 [Corallococcus sp. CA047B]|uniref:SIR2 family protein n=1 Tax=Corallococcus sp. CA047B TaxID=2316729 RepID=UPI000EA32782|nr:SIR2 family protein [Corallococcus sp. CA047B]RKH15992.1 hypothetical protein D7X74_16820 [Corallococcus sp. CA047B]